MQHTSPFCAALRAAAIVTSLASAAASAADNARNTPTPAPAGPARQAVAAPLKGDLRLSPGNVPRLVIPALGLDTLAKDFNKFSGDAKAFESMVKAVPGMAQECANKSYSVQDQTKAGCTANDTVAQCSDKLLKHCLQSYQSTSLPVLGLGGGSAGGVRLPNAGAGNAKIGFSLQEFQKTAAATAAEARALSQQLAAYATQVELNAKKVLP
ncbi:MAG: hypothetical protein JNJ42_06660 [Burkholderiaceae bacterium]|nr:hypothetical protein [Burkholderiaceae bacterium]